MRLQLGGESRVNEARINPLLNCEQLLWNSHIQVRIARPFPHGLCFGRLVTCDSRMGKYLGLYGAAWAVALDIHGFQRRLYSVTNVTYGLSAVDHHLAAAGQLRSYLRASSKTFDHRLLLEHRSLAWLFCVGWRAFAVVDQSEQPARANAHFYSEAERSGNSLDIARPFLLIRSAIAGICLIKAARSRL